MIHLFIVLSMAWILILAYLWLSHYERRVRIAGMTLIVVGSSLIMLTLLVRASLIHSLEDVDSKPNESAEVGVTNLSEANEVLHESNQRRDYMYYKRKPVLIEAIQYNGDNIEKILDWCVTNGVRYAYTTSTGKLFIRTADGDEHAPTGAYVVRDEENFYTLFPDEFEEKYEKVD